MCARCSRQAAKKQIKNQSGKADTYCTTTATRDKLGVPLIVVAHKITAFHIVPRHAHKQNTNHRALPSRLRKCFPTTSSSVCQTTRNSLATAQFVLGATFFARPRMSKNVATSYAPRPQEPRFLLQGEHAKVVRRTNVGVTLILQATRASTATTQSHPSTPFP